MCEVLEQIMDFQVRSENEHGQGEARRPGLWDHDGTPIDSEPAPVQDRFPD
jgi:hypothetical protein